MFDDVDRRLGIVKLSSSTLVMRALKHCSNSELALRTFI